MSRLLARIDQDLNSCIDPQRRAELLAERACYLARIGDFAGAKDILLFLRREFGDGHSARISVWIMLIEGLVFYFDGFDPRALDRITRASVIGAASQLGELTKTAQAWLAHIEFNRYEFLAMAAAINKCRPVSSTESCQWHARVCLIVADANMYAGQLTSGNRWYQRARNAAVTIGDEATISAVIYNRAAMNLARFRLEAISGNIDRDSLNLLSLEMSSARNFDAAVGHTSLAQLIEACRARIVLSLGDFASALALYEKILKSDNIRFGYHSDEFLLRIEYIKCLLGNGLKDEATELLTNIDLEQTKDMTSDDRYIFFVEYSELTERLEVSTSVVSRNTWTDNARSVYLSDKALLKRLLDELRLDDTY
jgi:hypothetical protein